MTKLSAWQSVLVGCTGPEWYCNSNAYLGISKVARCSQTLLQLTKQFCKEEYTKEIWFTSERSIASPLGTGGLHYFVRKRWSSLLPRTAPSVLSAEHYKTKVIVSFCFRNKDTKLSEKKRARFCRRCLVSNFHLKAAEELLMISLATTWANFYFSSQAIWNGLNPLISSKVCHKDCSIRQQTFK